MSTTFEFFVGTTNYFTVTLIDKILKTPLDHAVVTCTLYKDRDKEHPQEKPGTAVIGMSGLTMLESSLGVYSVRIPDNFAPMAGSNYVLSITAIAATGDRGTFEDYAKVLVAPIVS